MDLQKVIEAGRSGLVFALISIICRFSPGLGSSEAIEGATLLTGLVGQHGIRRSVAGSAIAAAMSTVMDAPQEDVSVAIGTVFLLNAVAFVAVSPAGPHAEDDARPIWDLERHRNPRRQ